MNSDMLKVYTEFYLDCFYLVIYELEKTFIAEMDLTLGSDYDHIKKLL